MRFFNFVLSLALFSTLSAAWPWPPSFENIDYALVRRQQDQSTTDGDRPTPEPASSGDANQPEETGTTTGDSEPTNTNDSESTVTSDSSDSPEETGSRTASGDESNTDDGTSSRRRTSSISINPGGAQGAVSMLTPAQTETTYIKIDEMVTFVWNYTNLAVTPTAIDVVASNQYGTWTLTSNMTVEETGSLTWNTSNEETSLVMASYTLAVYDSEEGPTGIPQPGRLSPYQGYQFAMYSPRDAEPASDFFCVTCNAGILNAERQSLRVLMLVATLTVLSFTYFACGFLGV